MVNFIFLFFYSYYHMKKNTIKAFTLVEMLIVIVIIGILIASLMPRMSAAQGRARDVARKNDLQQLQTAIIAYQWDHGALPDNDGNLHPCSDLDTEVKESAWMSAAPTDPQTSNVALGQTPGQYAYKTYTRNWVSNGWFILAAKVEVPGSANYCVSSANTVTKSDGTTALVDVADLKLCNHVTEWTTLSVADPDACTCALSELYFLSVY